MLICDFGCNFRQIFVVVVAVVVLGFVTASLGQVVFVCFTIYLSNYLVECVCGMSY